MIQPSVFPWRLSVVTVTAGMFLGLAWPRAARAQYKGHPFGVGLVAGDPTGITGKAWFSDRQAIQFGLGWHPVYRGRHGPLYPGPSVSVDWVYRFARIRGRKVNFGFHVGAGGGVGFPGGSCYHDVFGKEYCGSVALRLRVPVALNVYLVKLRFEFFGELVPGIRLIPPAYPMLLFTFGARYYL